MDYFNFYFLKKLLNNNKFRKILLFVFLFLIILFLKNNVFALDFIYDGTQYVLPDIPSDAYENYFIFADGTSIKLVTLYPSTRVSYQDNKLFCSYNKSAPSSEKTYFYYSCINNAPSWTGGRLNSDNTGFFFSGFTSSNEGTRHIIYSNFDIYNGLTGNEIYFEASDVHNMPYIINPDVIPTWNFSTLNIGGGSQFQATLPQKTDFTLFIYYANSYFSIDIKPYMQHVDNNNHVVFYVPKQKLLTNYNIVGDETLHFVLRTVFHDDHTSDTIIDNWELGTYTLNIDSSAVGEINDNSNRELSVNIDESINNQTQVIEQQTQKIEETTDAVNDLNNTISDPNIDSGADDLPSLDLNNPANTPLDNIFTLIYNAFCTGQPQDIVFPIPFTNKNITLSPYYIRDMLNNNGGAWVVTFINMFWEFMVGLFIIKDVSHKINKIKSGNIENIQNENIKEDML